MLRISRGVNRAGALCARAQKCAWRVSRGDVGLVSSAAEPRCRRKVHLRIRCRPRRGFAAPTLALNVATHPMTTADGHAREARLPGLPDRSPQDFGLKARRSLAARRAARTTR